MIRPDALFPIGPALSDAIGRAELETVRRPGTHDAIVVGTGAAGGMAAMLLAEAGLRVLALDAGLRPSWLRAPLRRATGALVRKVADPRLRSYLPAKLIRAGRLALRQAGRVRQPLQRMNFAWDGLPEAFVDDVDCPYSTPDDQPFDWYRARAIGGRMVIPGHGRQYYRLGYDDFAPVDGLSPTWPFEPAELDPWYALVERRLGLSGVRDGLACLPDSEIARTLSPLPAEAALGQAITGRWAGARPVLARYAPPLAGLEQAAATGRLLCRQGAVAREVEVDGQGRACAVTWHDQQSGATQRAEAPIVFLCASALESTRILMLSRSARAPEGLGASSGALGRNLMDHLVLQANGQGPRLVGEPVQPEPGRCVYVPRFDARDAASPPPGRGFGVQIYQSSGLPGRSYFTAVAFSEMLPRPENRVSLDPRLRDAWGVPALRIECRRSQADLESVPKMAAALRELAQTAGATLEPLAADPSTPGSAMHECGTARMGTDPANSVLDPNAQCWDAQGLYVTDGAAFPSQGNQNPTLTILALTARACDHAVRSLRGRAA